MGSNSKKSHNFIDQFKRRKILIVDDEKFIRKMFREVLKNRGYIVDESPDGQDAEEKIAKTFYDFISMDIMMPRIQGIEVLEFLQKNKIKSGPIVIVSNINEESLIQTAIKLGARDYKIVSDITPSDYLSVVESYLGNRTILEIVAGAVRKMHWLVAFAVIVLLLLLPIVVFLFGQEASVSVH